MLVHESRILQVTPLWHLAEQPESVGFQPSPPDVMTIADEVDAQLTQTMDSSMNAMHGLLDPM